MSKHPRETKEDLENAEIGTSSPTASPPSKKQKLASEIAIGSSSSNVASSSSEALLPSSKTFLNSTAQDGNVANAGDLIIVHLNDEDVRPLTLVRGETLRCKFGNFAHDSFIGKTFGSRVYQNPETKAKKKIGYVYMLRPTPNLWTKALHHRTQILYHVDIGMVCQYLKLSTGKRVVEAGTGSGSLSHTMARLIAPTGKLFTFEFHEPRYLEAKKEFASHGFSDIVTITHRDVMAGGFLVPGVVEPHSVDAIFLDLPQPWECIEHAWNVLKSDGAICCFSPCIEQVQRSCEKLREFNFFDIKTIECIAKEYKFDRVEVQDHIATSLKGYEVLLKNERDLLRRTAEKSATEPQQEPQPAKQEKKKKKNKKNNQHGAIEPVQKIENFAVPHTEMRGHTSYLSFAKVANFTKPPTKAQGTTITI